MSISFQPHKKILAVLGGLALVISGSVLATAGAVEPEKQPIYSNIENGSLCGTSNSTPCTVPTDQRLIIEYVSGFAFAPASTNQTTVVDMVVNDKGLGLNGRLSPRGASD